VCARCGQTGRRLVIHDRRVKRWRHLDLGATRCVIECELRLLRCPDCRVVRAEPVPWARPGAHHTRDFEDVVAWLAQQMAKTPITGLLRVGWDTVGKIVARVVADHLDESGFRPCWARSRTPRPGAMPRWPAPARATACAACASVWAPAAGGSRLDRAPPEAGGCARTCLGGHAFSDSTAAPLGGQLELEL